MNKIFNAEKLAIKANNKLIKLLDSCKYKIIFYGLDIEHSDTVYVNYHSDGTTKGCYGMCWSDNLLDMLYLLFKSNIIEKNDGIEELYAKFRMSQVNENDSLSSDKIEELLFLYYNYDLINQHSERDRIIQLIESYNGKNLEIVRTLLNLVK